MAKTVGQRPEPKYEAYVDDGYLFIIKEIGPQDLSVPDPNNLKSTDGIPIGTKMTREIEKIPIKDVPTFVNEIERQQEMFELAITQAKEQIEALENQGVHEIGPHVEEIKTLLRDACPTEKKWNKFAKRFEQKFEQFEQMVRGWSQHKRAVFQLGQAQEYLRMANQTMDLITKNLKNGEKKTPKPLAQR